MSSIKNRVAIVGGMSLALTAGYIAAFPVNYVLVGKGIRHFH